MHLEKLVYIVMFTYSDGKQILGLKHTVFQAV